MAKYRKAAKPTVHETLTDIMIERVEARRAAGENVVAPWRMTWDPSLGQPRNLTTGHAYLGVNVFMTLFQGYASPFWLTRKQAEKLGGTIKKRPGETVTLRNGDVIPASEPYTPIVFWNFPDEEQKKAGRGAFVRFYQVWNTEQVDGIEEPVAKALGDIEQTHKDPIAEGEALVKGYAGGPVISNGSSRAFYTPGTDQVTMPEMQAFESAESYYRVLFHELTHSTGHRTRLERDGVANPAAFASHAYSEEELIAEMGASMLAGFAGIGSEAADENSAAYLDHWLRKLRAEPKMLMAAGGAAQKAIDHIRGIKWDLYEQTARALASIRSSSRRPH